MYQKRERNNVEISWPLASSSWDSEEYQAIQEVIDSGFFSMGKRTAEFEEQFAQWAGRKYAVMVNSGSSANLIAASALRYVRDTDAIPNHDGLIERLEQIKRRLQQLKATLPSESAQEKVVTIVPPTAPTIVPPAPKKPAAPKSTPPSMDMPSLFD